MQKIIEKLGLSIGKSKKADPYLSNESDSFESLHIWPQIHSQKPSVDFSRRPTTSLTDLRPEIFKQVHRTRQLGAVTHERFVTLAESRRIFSIQQQYFKDVALYQRKTICGERRTLVKKPMEKEQDFYGLFLEEARDYIRDETEPQAEHRRWRMCRLQEQMKKTVTSRSSSMVALGQSNEASTNQKSLDRVDEIMDGQVQ